jgi:hypothetical protein
VQRQLLIWVSILLVSSRLVLAQSPTGTLVGVVSDASGAAIAGVSILAIEVDTNHSRTAATNESGIYSISNLTSGNYQVEFTYNGFKKVVQTEVRIEVNGTARLDRLMEVGSLEEVVQVISSLRCFKDTSSTGGTIDGG